MATVVGFSNDQYASNFENLLIALLRCQRPDYGVVQQTVPSDVEVLYKATEGRIGTDERTCIETSKHRWLVGGLAVSLY